MPPIHRPRDPNYGIRKVRKHNVVRRKPITLFVLPETKTYIEAQGPARSPGRVIDDAVRLYAQSRELSNEPSNTDESTKPERIGTTVSQETIAYVRFMRSAMSPGRLVDVAIKLYKEVYKNE